MQAQNSLKFDVKRYTEYVVTKEPYADTALLTGQHDLKPNDTVFIRGCRGTIRAVVRKQRDGMLYFETPEFFGPLDLTPSGWAATAIISKRSVRTELV